MADYKTYQEKMDAAKDAEEKAKAVLNRSDLTAEQRENLSKEMMQRAADFRRQAMRYAR
jgi:hypothetical protein